MKDLTFARFRDINLQRASEAREPLEEWSPSDWGCALAGEVGELCNFIKKMRRGQDVPLEALAKEIGDIQTYLVLLSARLNIDLQQATIEKFDEISDRWGWSGPRLREELSDE